MHRLATTPGGTGEEDAGAFVEQPPAPVLLLTSADTDLLTLQRLLQSHPHLLGAELRGLNLRALSHPAVIDHYLASTAQSARIVLVRLLGGRGHWSYGLEQLRLWMRQGNDRTLMVLAGTAEEEETLAALGNTDPEVVIALARCLREGGADNGRAVLQTLASLLRGQPVSPPIARPLPDPCPHDWQEEDAPRVGVVLYRAWYQAGDLRLMEACLASLRKEGLSPRALWVSGLRDAAVQQGVVHLFRREHVEAVLCSTAFASVSVDEANLGAPLWDALGVPVLQLLCSSQPRQQWQQNSVGLAPTDLALQVALPELDGRITTRIGAFKEPMDASLQLASALYSYVPDPERLTWISRLTAGWVRLRQRATEQRRVTLVLANYPARNGRLANGVGLDTPASTAAMLRWLRDAGYAVSGQLPATGDELIQALVSGRSNDPEGDHRQALDHLPLEAYRRWYDDLPEDGRLRLESIWGPPDKDAGLELSAERVQGFPIRGLAYGSVTVLIQPERGYGRDPRLCYHSPDLPPTHAYLAQYLWLRQVFRADVVMHVGKHGNLEWLPGKGLGLSEQCFPEWALGPLPHLYPFIVNDPGEGAQAKRRSQAVILDHLTPPLGRAGLHGPLAQLEALLDEYWEAAQVGHPLRAALLRDKLETQINQLELPLGSATDLDSLLDAADGYLCELKEAQIRLGLHTFGQLPDDDKLAELLLCLGRPPQSGLPGLTQALAMDQGLELDPWGDSEDLLLSEADHQRLAPARRVGDAVEQLELQALGLCQHLLGQSPRPGDVGERCQAVLDQMARGLLPRLLACGHAERQAFLDGLEGRRIAAGPSGAPTRGRPDLLPTGRNFYTLDLRGLPTEAAWDLGRRSAALLLELHLQDEGEHLRHLALSVWGTSTMRNGGEDIAQALALLGVRPVWDGPTRRMVDLELIPLHVLNRPRVDVTLRISGLFRDAFPNLVSWMNRATALVAAQEESELENPLAAASRREGHAARVYGSAPGAYGAGLQGLIDSGAWETRADLGEAFLNWSSWRYESADPGLGSGMAGATPIEASGDRRGLEQRLASVQVVLHNQDNREHDLLDSDDYYQFQGGLSAAVEKLQGEAPGVWFADHSRHARPRIHRLEREFDKVIRSRLLNPRWISAMQGHGYKGGFEMAASLDYLFAYDASTGRVPDWSYGAITDHWLQAPEVHDFLKQSNPWALRDMAERLLEAHHRGLWKSAEHAQLDVLRNLVLESEGQIEQR